MQSGSDRRSPPGAYEIEVSVFGTGFGESIVVHMGMNRWMVVDSCRDPETRSPMPLEYLAEIGVDLANSIKLIVATHWDDDHIDGIAELFDRAKSAVFACPATLAEPEFAAVLATVSGTKFMPGGPGAAEINEVMKELKKRKKRGPGYNPPSLAAANTVLLDLDGALSARILSLSPSHAEVLSATERLRDIPKPKEGLPRRRLPRFDSNDASVAISIEIQDNELLLLGADLEERSVSGVGWQAVVAGWPSHRGKHSMFKVAHHGSSNGHLDAVWDVLLRESPWAVVTPFRKGRTRLPKPEDCERIIDKTELARITGAPSFRRYRDLNPAVRRTIDEVAKSARFVTSGAGQVRLRRDLNSTQDWGCELFGSATPIDRSFIARLASE
jgi:hypothetical protein